MNRFTSKLSKEHKIFAGTIIIYLAAIAALTLTGHFTFFTKTAIIPILFIASFLAGRFVPFVKEWSVYISLVILFDAIRGYIFVLINKFQIPVWANYVIDPEKSLFNGKIASEILQNAFYDPTNISAFDKFMTFTYGSHFAFFILFSFLIWFNRKEAFNQFKNGILIVMYSGLLGYFLIPTIPPWIASLDLDLLPELHIIYMKIYNTISPELRTAFDTNPIAAMPSLHSAFPFFITLVAFRHYKWKGIISLIYTLTVFLSLVYGAQHYILDIAGGILIAFFAYYIAYSSNIPAKTAQILENLKVRIVRVRLSEITWKLAISFLILMLTELAGQTNISYFKTNSPKSFINNSFVANELDNRSRLANYYRGLNSLKVKDYESARESFRKASLVIPVESRYYNLNLDYYAQTVFIGRDYTRAAEIFSRMNQNLMTLQSKTKYINSLIASRNSSKAFIIAENSIKRFPGNLQIIYLKYKAGFLSQKISSEKLISIIEKLKNSPDPKNSKLRSLLIRLLKAAEKS